MLGGEYKHSLDAKNRVFIPSKLRDELGKSFVVAKDIREKCLKVFSNEGWEAYTAPIKAQNRKLAEFSMRYLNSSMLQAVPDSQGRILLPAELVGYAEIDRNVVIVGCGDYAEIWSEAEYEKLKSNMDLDEMLRQLEALGL